MSITTEQYGRLPVWARQHIDRLTRDLNTARDAIKTLSGEVPESPVTVDPYGDHPFHLHPSTTVAFKVDDDIVVRVHLRRDPGGKMVLDLNSTGRKQIAVMPRAANSAYIVGVDP